jgi:hypothetical protein
MNVSVEALRSSAEGAEQLAVHPDRPVPHRCVADGAGREPADDAPSGVLAAQSSNPTFYEQADIGLDDLGVQCWVFGIAAAEPLPTRGCVYLGGPTHVTPKFSEPAQEPQRRAAIGMAQEYEPAVDGDRQARLRRTSGLEAGRYEQRAFSLSRRSTEPRRRLIR